MKLLKFSKEVFKLLSNQGVRYCYSRTLINDNEPGRVRIVLTPCFGRPDVRRLPKNFDTFFSLKRELRQMAEGIDDDVQVYLTYNNLR